MPEASENITRVPAYKEEDKDEDSSENEADLADSDAREESKGRHENSLGELTRKFISLIKKAANSCVDLNEVVQKLRVQKRRVYDITNVLEGIL